MIRKTFFGESLLVSSFFAVTRKAENDRVLHQGGPSFVIRVAHEESGIDGVSVRRSVIILVSVEVM